MVSEDLARQGLSDEQAIQLQKDFGPNQIVQEKKRPAWLLFLAQFQSPLVIILLFAVAVSLFLGEQIEALAISAILVINGIIGFLQEFRAENAIAALHQMTAPRATVRRSGQQKTISAVDVVPGDLLWIEPGDVVAADGELLEAARLRTNEALLTGESLPVSKSLTLESRRVFMGTSVLDGSGLVRVSSIGMKTELGRIAHLLTEAQESQSPLQKQLGLLGRQLLVICLALVSLVAIVGLLRGNSWIETLLFSVSLAVAAVPEGLPTIVTVALALGVQRMSAKRALIRRLPSVETLGSVSVICTDKTGTLTTGRMRVRDVWGPSSEKVLRVAASCCEAELVEGRDEGVGDPTEIAILLAAREKGFERRQIEIQNPRKSAEPFDSDRKRMSIFREDGVNYLKGAIESLVEICRKDDPMAAEALEEASRMGERGLRVLGVAVGPSAAEKDVQIVGLLGMADPPREEAKAAIHEAREAGIVSVMITGDHHRTATSIAREIGLLQPGESAEERVHARATPEDKLQLVRRWKSRGAIVAMTGDGVNDAPALREADVGIAMGITGTEVTRQAADLVLADDNFATIIEAVREGRGTFQNIRKAMTYLLVGNFAEIFLVLGAVLIGFPLPLLAAHLLWINLVTDALPALTLIADPLSPHLMKRPPRSLGEKILGRPEWSRILGVALIEATVILVFYSILLNQGNQEGARGLVFTALVFSQLFRSFGARSTRRTFWEVGVWGNPWLLAVVVATSLLQVSLHLMPWTQVVFELKPLSASDFLMVIGVGLVTSVVIESGKLFRRIQRN